MNFVGIVEVHWSILEPYLTQRKDQLLSVSSFECEATPNHHNFTSKDGEDPFADSVCRGVSSPVGDVSL